LFQKSLLPEQDPANAVFDTTLPGLPIADNLSARAGLRFNGFERVTAAEAPEKDHSA
jgi:hypothetical protein